MSKRKTVEEMLGCIGDESETDENTDECDSQPLKRKVGDPPCSIPIEKSSRPKPTEEELDSDYVQQSSDSDENRETDANKPSEEDVASSSKRWRRANVAKRKRTVITNKRASGQAFIDEHGIEKGSRAVRECLCNHSGKCFIFHYQFRVL